MTPEKDALLKPLWPTEALKEILRLRLALQECLPDQDHLKWCDRHDGSDTGMDPDPDDCLQCFILQVLETPSHEEVKAWKTAVFTQKESVMTSIRFKLLTALVASAFRVFMVVVICIVYSLLVWWDLHHEWTAKPPLTGTEITAMTITIFGTPFLGIFLVTYAYQWICVYWTDLTAFMWEMIRQDVRPDEESE